jgi:hypothetical protein
MKSLAAGVLAGTVGTAALNIATYADISVRGRPASDLPARAAGVWAARLGLPLGDEETAAHRREGLGALFGYATGVGTGVGYGLMRAGRRDTRRSWDGVLLGLAAMVLADSSLVALGLTGPRSWGVAGWLSDLLPHAAYGYAAVATYAAARG